MNAPHRHRRQWRFHDAANKEFENLPQNGQQGLAELMQRFRSDESSVLPREISNYGKGIYGLKYSEAHNEFRLYFGRVGGHGQVLVAVEAVYKKTESPQLATARARLAEWRAENAARKKREGREG